MAGAMGAMGAAGESGESGDSGALQRIWDAVTSVQEPASTTVVLATAALALVLVVVPGLWRHTRHLVTIAHEGGHGVAALLSGRRLAGIRLHSDTSGLTLSRGPARGPGMVATALAGYLAPSVLGLVAAWMLTLGRAVLMLWLTALLLALLLLQIRNFFGLGLVLVAGAGVVAVSWWATEEVQSAVAYAGAWFLLLAAPRPVLELQAKRRRDGARGSDADVLSRLTRLPAGGWVLVFLGVTVGVLVLGGWLVLRPLTDLPVPLG